MTDTKPQFRLTLTLKLEQGTGASYWSTDRVIAEAETALAFPLPGENSGDALAAVLDDQMSHLIKVGEAAYAEATAERPEDPTDD